jgi:hypothetical protein
MLLEVNFMNRLYDWIQLVRQESSISSKASRPLFLSLTEPNPHRSSSNNCRQDSVQFVTGLADFQETPRKQQQ